MLKNVLNIMLCVSEWYRVAAPKQQPNIGKSGKPWSLMVYSVVFSSLLRIKLTAVGLMIHDLLVLLVGSRRESSFMFF